MLSCELLLLRAWGPLFLAGYGRVFLGGYLSNTHAHTRRREGDFWQNLEVRGELFG
jgi:hypothetical protein